MRREISLEALAGSLDQSSVRLERILPAPDMSPSCNMQQLELEMKLADILSEMPDDYREVIVLRHLEALPFERVGQRMKRSTGAARMLWLRAIQSLRERMQS